MEKLESNELIARFMGGKPCDRCKDCGMWVFENGDERFLKYLTYDKSWDLLMPVVENIGTIITGCIISIDNGYGYNKCVITDNFPSSLNIEVANKETLIQAIHAAVIQFIQFYNEKK